MTIPQILPILMPVIIMATFTAFKQFDIVYLMTMQTGSKTGADINTVITYVYEKRLLPATMDIHPLWRLLYFDYTGALQDHEPKRVFNLGTVRGI